MPEIRSLESVKADLEKVEMHLDPTTSSPQLKGGDNPGVGKPSGEKMELRRTSMSRAAHKGGSVTRKME